MKTILLPGQEFPLTPESAELLCMLIETAIKSASDVALVSALMDASSQYEAILGVLTDCNVPKRPEFIVQLVFRHILQLVVEREVALRILTEPNSPLKDLQEEVAKPYSTESFLVQYKKAYESSLQAVGL